MIHGRLVASGGTRRPFILAHVSVPSESVADNINFLVDTGADGTLLAPSDATRLRINVARLPPGPSSNILAHFALFYEERTGRVLLLMPSEADALGLP